MSLLYGNSFEGQTDLSGKNYAFYGLFKNCTTLQNAKNLILPATTLVEYCYGYMFRGCSSLTTAQELHATTLTFRCYQGMFQNCSNLNKITMLATDIRASFCLNDWVNGVASSGTFIKNASMTSLPTATSSNNYKGIPNGWIVQNY